MEACNLGSINLARFVTVSDDEMTIDYAGLKEVVWQRRPLSGQHHRNEPVSASGN